jgi:hypothetical protein
MCEKPHVWRPVLKQRPREGNPPKLLQKMAASRAPPAAVDGGIEENAMAILDSSDIKDPRDLHDDRNRLPLPSISVSVYLPPSLVTVDPATANSLVNSAEAAFLEAVRSACLAADNPSAPSWYAPHPAQSRFGSSFLKFDFFSCAFIYLFLKFSASLLWYFGHMSIFS